MNRLNDRLDAVDRRLIAILQVDARRSTASIAREVNLSRTAVQARIARLEEDGAILGYSAAIDPRADGSVNALVFLSFAIHPCRTILDIVLRWPEVRHGYSIAGERDAALIVSSGSNQALSELSDRFRAVEGIATVETVVILAEHRNEGSTRPGLQAIPVPK